MLAFFSHRMRDDRETSPLSPLSNGSSMFVDDPLLSGDNTTADDFTFRIGMSWSGGVMAFMVQCPRESASRIQCMNNMKQSRLRSANTRSSSRRCRRPESATVGVACWTDLSPIRTSSTRMAFPYCSLIWGKSNGWRDEVSYGTLRITGTPGSLHPGGCLFAMGDGTVRWVSESISNQTLYSLSTIAGGEVADLD